MNVIIKSLFQDYPKADAYLGDLLFVYVLVTYMYM